MKRKVFIFSSNEDSGILLSVLERYGFSINCGKYEKLLILDFNKKKIEYDHNTDYGKYVLDVYYHEIPGDWGSSIRMDDIRTMHANGTIDKPRMVYKIPNDNGLIIDEIKKLGIKLEKFKFENLVIEIL